MLSEIAVQAILKKCVNKIINIEVKLCVISICVFCNIYIGSASFFMRIVWWAILLYFSVGIMFFSDKIYVSLIILCLTDNYSIGVFLSRLFLNSFGVIPVKRLNVLLK